MFFRVFLLFALAAVAFAIPQPDPQVITYSAPAVYPAYSAYSAYAPVAYSAYSSPYAAAAYPYAYSGYYLKK